MSVEKSPINQRFLQFWMKNECLFLFLQRYDISRSLPYGDKFCRMGDIHFGKRILFAKVTKAGHGKENHMWKKIKDFIVVAIGIISGILTIISFIWLVLDVKIKKLNLVIDLNFFFENINIALFLVIMIICLFYIGLMRKEEVKNMKMWDEILLRYNKVLSTIQKWFLISLEKGSDSYQKIAYEIRSLFKEIYNKTIRVQIKMIQEGQGVDAYVQTLCNTQEKLMPMQLSMQKIKENSDFLQLIQTGEGYFSFSKKSKKSTNMYMSSNPNWREKHLSTLVLPIKKANENGMMDIVGFLCLDSSDADTFNEEVNRLIIPLLDTITGYLYLILESGIKHINESSISG